MRTINNKWLSGIENQDEFEKKMIEQRELFSRFYDLMDKKAQSVYQDQIKKGNYDDPNWDTRQADSVGYARCLNDIMALLNYTQEE